MPLPTCECITGKPIQQQLGAIYCVLLEILAGQGGGEITLSQISDLDGSWITPLQTPISTFGAAIVASSPNNGEPIVNNAGLVDTVSFQQIVDGSTIVASMISDATPAAQGLLTTLPAGDPSGSYVVVDDANSSNVVNNNFSGSGLTTVDVTDGLVTNGS